MEFDPCGVSQNSEREIAVFQNQQKHQLDLIDLDLSATDNNQVQANRKEHSEEKIHIVDFKLMKATSMESKSIYKEVNILYID